MPPRPGCPLSAPAIARATGLSVGYCRRVKAGVVTPHPMWWEAMRDIAFKEVGVLASRSHSRQTEMPVAGSD